MAPIIVLLGDDLARDTVLGDPNRSESGIKDLTIYLNQRLWEVPEGTTVTVEELRHADRKYWPRSQAEGDSQVETIADINAAGGQRGAATVKREIRGARDYIEDVHSASGIGGQMAASGAVELADGTEIEWRLWAGDRPHVDSYAAMRGYVAARYDNELFDLSNQAWVYRAFGIIDKEVRDRLWLIANPPLAVPGDPRAVGIYPMPRGRSCSCAEVMRTRDRRCRGPIGVCSSSVGCLTPSRTRSLARRQAAGRSTRAGARS